MAGNLSAADRMDLEGNPAYLQREIARYLQIKEEAEQARRDVVAAVTSKEDLARAETLRREAETLLDEARKSAGDMIRNADEQAKHTRESAERDAAGVRAQAEKEAAQQQAALDSKREALEQAMTNARVAHEASVEREKELSASIERTNIARKLHEEEQQKFQRRSEALAKLVHDMQEVLGGRGEPTRTG